MVQRAWASINPIFSVNDPSLACNNPGTPPTSYIPIRAGDNITAVYWYWLHPVGPMTVWLSRCETDCRDVNASEARWFKIWEAGLLTGPNLAEGMWYQKQFQNWDGSPDLWPVTIPAVLRSGLYMIRHEILSIHVEDKPQFYPECAHLNITGDWDLLPPEEFLLKFPGVYQEDGKCSLNEVWWCCLQGDAYPLGDPSIMINIYSDQYANSTVSARGEAHGEKMADDAELYNPRWTNLGRVSLPSLAGISR